MAATSPSHPLPDYEQAGELKIGQVGIANLRVRTLDIDKLVAEMRERVGRAPKLFTRAAVVIDFGGLAQTPDAVSARKLIEGLRDTGVIPVALAYGTSDNQRLAEQLELPLLAKFRAQYESTDAVRRPTVPEPPPEPQAPETVDKPVAPGLIQAAPVRSGQQLYADNRDLTVLTSVGAGAEVIADGSIHVYGPLRGRALAGARGNGQARIFCRQFHAELVAIAGQYKVLEDIPPHLRGQAVQVWLDRSELKITALE